jgi:nitrate reductase NapD
MKEKSFMRTKPEFDNDDGFAVASMVIAAKPGEAVAVRSRLEALPGVEVHACTEEGKMVITIDRDSEGESIDLLGKIESLEGVVSASLVYHYCDNAPA